MVNANVRVQHVLVLARHADVAFGADNDRCCCSNLDEEDVLPVKDVQFVLSVNFRQGF